MCDGDKKLAQLEEICKATDQLRAENVYLKKRVADLEAGINQAWNFILGKNPNNQKQGGKTWT